MPETKKIKKIPQISLSEYNKIKEKRAISKLKVHFPLITKLLIIFPLVYFTFLVIYYLTHLRFLREH